MCEGGHGETLGRTGQRACTAPSAEPCQPPYTSPWPAQIRSWLSDAGSTAACNCLLHLCLESGPTQATHNTQQPDSHREEHHVCNCIFPATLAMKRFSRCGVIATLTPNCESICEL